MKVTSFLHLKLVDLLNGQCLVLDGQQRLQSMFIGLLGSYDGREHFLEILCGEVSANSFGCAVNISASSRLQPVRIITSRWSGTF
uniref:DUF262 domain-containing protein n=1 Tax=Desulfatirhabdium butyrativorans TaxID=340467 RepID=A0A7C4RNR4_9BACT